MRNSNSPHWIGQLALGAGLGVLAITADAVDLQQNISFGLESNTLAAVTYGLAALGVLVIPAAAERVGWSMLLRGVALASVLLTFVAALNYHANSEGRRISQGQDKASTYETAKADAEAARTELKTLPAEPLAIAELEQLVSATKKTADDQEAADTKRMGEASCFSKCKDARKDHDAKVARLGVAKRRAELEGKIAAAKVEAKAGPEVPSGLAVMIADTGFAKSQGWTAAGVAWTIAELMMLARIALTMAFASLGGYAVRLTAEGWAARPWRNTAAKARTEAKGTPSPKPRKRAPKSQANPTAGAEIRSLHVSQKMAARQTVAQLLASGLSQREVSRRTGIAKSTVSAWAKAAKLATTGQAAPIQIAAHG